MARISKMPKFSGKGLLKGAMGIFGGGAKRWGNLPRTRWKGFSLPGRGRGGDPGADDTAYPTHHSQIDVLTGKEIEGAQAASAVPTEALPQYEFLKWVSSGSYGSVWVVRIRATESIRALKIMHRDGFPNEQAYERELEGLKAYEAVASEHPSLVNILYAEKRDSGEHGPFYFYLMRLAEDIQGLPCREQITDEQPGVLPIDYEARTLSSELRKYGRLPIPRAVKIARDLALALDHLHQNHLVHRDVKPSNVLFVNGLPLLADVGLVVRENEDDSRLGSRPYVPREGSGTASADVFALGKVLFQMVTGGGPDDYPFVPAKFEERLAENRDLRRQWADLEPVIDTCCDTETDERYPDGAALAEELEKIVSPPPKLWRKFVLPVSLVAVAGLMVWGTLQYLDYRVRPGTLTLIVQPEDAQVKVGDSTYVGGTVHAAGISPGSGRIEIDHPNFHGIERTIQLEPGQDLHLGEITLQPATGRVAVTTLPSGAVVRLDGVELGVTPLDHDLLVPGKVTLEFALDGFRTATRDLIIREGETTELGLVELRFFSPPRPRHEWENSLGVQFPPRGNRHVAEQPVTLDELQTYTRSGYRSSWEGIPWISLREVEGFAFVGGEAKVALLTPDEVESFAAWLEAQDREAGFFDHEDTYAWRPLDLIVSAGTAPDGRHPYILDATKRTHVQISLTSSPPGAEVWLGGRMEGTTPDGRPLAISRQIRRGALLLCRRFGYRDYEYSSELRDFGTNQLSFRLESWWGGEAGTARPTNSLGMELVLIGDALWSAWEVRVADMDAFCAATGRKPLHKAVFAQEADHPAVNVTLEDAIAFCQWLTEKERTLGLLPHDVAYRVPTDLEWSAAAGIPEPAGLSLRARDASADREQVYPSQFPWGNQWPPPAGLGNYNFKEGASADPYPNTAPVGSFRANALGLHGTSGGVWEWVSDPYPRDGAIDLHVCRGGAYNNDGKKELLAGRRNLVEPNFRDVLYGFRPVLAKVPSEVVASVRE